MPPLSSARQTTAHFVRLLMIVLFSQLLGAFSARGVTLNSQEQAIADLLSHSSGQNRPFLQVDPILTQVARNRAADMARRGYFDHVNPDGHGPNYMVRAAGYPLPDWWGNDSAANYVESIAAGRDSASQTWSDWMASAPHKRHLLAETDFYQDETSFGVGFVSAPGSQYVTYWVVITAPPRPRPLLAITAPAAGARVTEARVSISGTSSGGTPAQFVQYRLENSNGVSAYVNAAGVSSWSAVVAGLAPGDNTIRIRSLDGTGTTLKEVTRLVRYAVLRPLTVSTNGSGSVTDAFAGQSQRELGVRYSITATPASGFIFSGWSGGITSSKATLAFTMSEGLQLVANFVPNPFLTMKGSYSGLVTGNSTASSDANGILTVALGGNGAFTGRLKVGSASYPISGKFGLGGRATITLPRAGSTPLTVQLQLDLSGAGGIAGTVSSSTWTSSVQASHAAGSTQGATFAGRYTIVLPPSTSSADSTVPQGNGYATLTITKSGTATLKASLADGRSFSKAGTITQQGTLPVYASLYSGGGYVGGQVRFNGTSVSDLDGTVHWSKPARAADRYYSNGFSIDLPVVGSRYVAPAAGTPVVQVARVENNSELLLGDGNLQAPVVQPLTLDATNKIRSGKLTVPDLTVKISPATGVFSGSFRHPVSGETRQLRGVIFQKQNAGFGYFLGINESGYSSFTAAE